MSGFFGGETIKKKLFLILALVLISCVAFSIAAYALLTKQLTVPSSGKLTNPITPVNPTPSPSATATAAPDTISFRIYQWDNQQGTVQHEVTNSNIDWGSFATSQGFTDICVSKTITVKNAGSVPFRMFLNTTNWSTTGSLYLNGANVGNPQNGNPYQYPYIELQPGESKDVTLGLNVVPATNPDFSVNIVFTATQI